MSIRIFVYPRGNLEERRMAVTFYPGRDTQLSQLVEEIVVKTKLSLHKNHQYRPLLQLQNGDLVHLSSIAEIQNNDTIVLLEQQQQQQQQTTSPTTTTTAAAPVSYSTCRIVNEASGPTTRSYEPYELFRLPAWMTSCTSMAYKNTDQSSPSSYSLSASSNSIEEEFDPRQERIIRRMRSNLQQRPKSKSEKIITTTTTTNNNHHHHNNNNNNHNPVESICAKHRLDINTSPFRSLEFDDRREQRNYETLLDNAVSVGSSSTALFEIRDDDDDEEESHKIFPFSWKSLKEKNDKLLQSFRTIKQPL